MTRILSSKIEIKEILERFCSEVLGLAQTSKYENMPYPFCVCHEDRRIVDHPLDSPLTNHRLAQILEADRSDRGFN
jgi:hypothetical protein